MLSPQKVGSGLLLTLRDIKQEKKEIARTAKKHARASNTRTGSDFTKRLGAN